MSSSEGAQYDPGPSGGAALNRGARGLAQKIKDWTDARIAAALVGRSGLTSLKINGAQIGLRQHLDVQMTGATGEDHPELDLLRAILPTSGGGGGGGVWTQIAQHTVPAGGEGEFSFSPIPDTFDHLVVVGDNILFVNTLGFVATGDVFHIQPNNWNGSDYHTTFHRYGGAESGAVAHGIDHPSTVGIGIGYADAVADWGGSDQAGFVLWILGYAVDVPTRDFFGHGNKGFSHPMGWQVDSKWRRPLDPPDNTTVISTLRVVASLLSNNSAGNLFAEGSRFTLYGLKNGASGGGTGIQTRGPIDFTSSVVSVEVYGTPEITGTDNILVLHGTGWNAWLGHRLADGTERCWGGGGGQHFATPGDLLLRVEFGIPGPDTVNPVYFDGGSPGAAGFGFADWAQVRFWRMTDTGFLSPGELYLDVSANGSTWTNVGGWSLSTPLTYPTDSQSVRVETPT